MSREQEHTVSDRRDRFALWIWLAGFAIMAFLIAYDSIHAITSR